MLFYLAFRLFHFAEYFNYSRDMFSICYFHFGFFRVKLTSAESLTLMQDTRLIQLDTAIQMELWQEAYRSAEDVHGMMQLSKDKDKRMVKPASYVNYYDKVHFVVPRFTDFSKSMFSFRSFVFKRESDLFSMQDKGERWEEMFSYEHMKKSLTFLEQQSLTFIFTFLPFFKFFF